MNVTFRLGELDGAVSVAGQATIGTRVFDVLRQAIVQQRFPPGHLLSEAEMAKQIGVSRQPVREAFIKLAEIGLVEIRPQRGTLVTLISRKEMENARFLREVIEVAIARKLALEITGQQIGVLKGMVDELSDARQYEDVPGFLRMDEEFHVKIAEFADCAYAWQVLDNLKVQIDRVRYLTHEDKTTAQRVIIQHRAIVDALATRSPDLAEAAMHQHMIEIINFMPAMVAAHPELFVDAEPDVFASAARPR